MKAPQFWTQPQTWQAKLLSPLSCVYASVVKTRLQRERFAYQSKLPVICVGNVTMGGAGKTPVVQAIVKLLQEQGKNPAILLRGYGGVNRKSVWVEKQTAKEVGDEALEHRRLARVAASRNRANGAKLIEEDDMITHIIMDDGLQNANLKKTISLLVVDGEQPFGNEMVFPAGPLREHIEDALRRVQTIVILGRDKFNLATRFGFVTKIIKATTRPKNPEFFAGKPVIAFAGIGRPQKFFDSLKNCDAVIGKTFSFADHHPYEEADLTLIGVEADRAKAMIVTTRKDWVRLPTAWQARVVAFDVELVWDDPQEIIGLLK
jgi:tetraacyldisaccharide 4'-kinase